MKKVLATAITLLLTSAAFATPPPSVMIGSIVLSGDPSTRSQEFPDCFPGSPNFPVRVIQLLGGKKYSVNIAKVVVHGISPVTGPIDIPFDIDEEVRVLKKNRLSANIVLSPALPGRPPGQPLCVKGITIEGDARNLSGNPEEIGVIGHP